MENIHKILDRSESFGGHEELLKQYLVGQLERYDRADEDPKAIAYEIAGLLSARSMMKLSKDSPFDEVFSMAVELELPYPHRSSNASWEALRTLVRQLP